MGKNELLFKVLSLVPLAITQPLRPTLRMRKENYGGQSRFLSEVAGLGGTVEW